MHASIPMCVRGAEEVFAILHEDVPDSDGVFDGPVLLVKESSIEEVPFVGTEADGFGEVLDLLEDPFGAGVVPDAFSVTVPEFDVVTGEDFD